MRHISRHIVLLVTLLAGVLFSACTFEQEDLFEEAAALRIDHFNDDLKSRLVEQSSADKYGWVIQYFVAGTDEEDFEGFNLFGRFSASGTALLAGNHRFLRKGNANKYTEAVSSYEMLKEEGSVVSFNTWNDVLTVFADPVNPSSAPSVIANDGEGMNGDYNFVFAGFEGDNILFRGERHDAEIRFVPCDRPWTQYIDDVAAAKKRITSSTLTTYYVTDGTEDTMYIDGLNTGVFVYEDRLNDPLQASTHTCVFTLNGLRLNHKMPFGENTFQEMTVAPDKERLLNEDGTVQIIPMWDSYIAESKSLYRLDPADFTTEQAALYAQMEIEVKKVNSKYELDSLTIGRISETQDDGSNEFMPGLIACVHGPKKMGRTPLYYPYVNMNIDKPTYGNIRFRQSSVDRPNTYMKMFDGTDLKTLCQQFAATLYGTYKMVPDDYFRPTVATLNPVSEGNRVTLILRPIKD